MKRIALLAAIGIMAISGAAWAPCHFLTFTPGVDCEYWTVDGSVNICGQYDTLGYVVTLEKDGQEVARFADHFLVTLAQPDFHFHIPWGIELCGDYVAKGHFFYVDPIEMTDVRDFELPLHCDCDEPDGECHYTPGYWKNHPEAWPVETLMLGGVSYTKAQLLDILDTPVRGNPLIILQHHLIAAKLNVANGADNSINDEIADADAILANPTAYTRDEIICAKNKLCAYNELILPGCEGYIEPPILYNRAVGTSAAPNTEDATWGAIKNIYR